MMVDEANHGGRAPAAFPAAAAPSDAVNHLPPGASLPRIVSFLLQEQKPHEAVVSAFRSPFTAERVHDGPYLSPLLGHFLAWGSIGQLWFLSAG
jgi:hypothetical protein